MQALFMGPCQKISKAPKSPKSTLDSTYKIGISIKYKMIALLPAIMVVTCIECAACRVSAKDRFQETPDSGHPRRPAACHGAIII